MSQEGSRFIYRVVSQAELENLKTTGRFRIGPRSSYEFGKWFALSPDTARRFKNELGIYGHTDAIVTAHIPRDVYHRSHLDEHIDRIGGILVYTEDLPRLIYIQ